ncbi:MAG: hypothetical protein KAS92_02560 [Candidatus Omnitrophica bacterium]|nr:hypothetical protein [Candidatus Omnitrophota bacterium]
MTTKRFTTFEGVFTPCLLSILGVIMYLRLGFVVGSIGLGGALIVIVLANMITLATALSMSSVVTNIRIGAGGVYSIITKSLGLEAGGAIGIPLYISQAISIAFYVTGFAECWYFIFPQHDVLLVSLMVWFLILIISYTSTKLAFRIQYVVMAFIGASIFSIILGKGSGAPAVVVWEQFSIKNFWMVFAIFFPAVTGILAGASMSGELKNPKVSIPKGTLWAIAVSFVVYTSLTFWFAKQVPLAELRTNTRIAVELGRWHWLVIAGIMGATLSSALVMTVGSPRILLALGKHSILPFSSVFSRVSKRGEPTAAILFTALVSLVTILLGSLDQIAGLLTMFFLITYGMINITVLIEESIGIASFRPTFRVPRIVPLFGSIGCVSVMFLINAKFSIISILVIVGMYFFLLKKTSSIYAPDVRSGLLVYLAECFAKAASRLPYYPKIWKPNLLVPVKDINAFARILPLIESIVFPSGRITAFKVLTGPEEGVKKDLQEQLASSVVPLQERNIFVETGIVEAEHASSGTVTIMQTVNNMFFPPNTLFTILDGGEDARNSFQDQGIIKEASSEGLGIIVLKHNEKVGVSQERIVNLWIRRQSPNINLAILIALQLEKNWQGAVRLIQVIDQESEKEEACTYLLKLRNLMRMSTDGDIKVMAGSFKGALKEAPPADINIFGMGEEPDIPMIYEVADAVQTSILFLRDSKHESALA